MGRIGVILVFVLSVIAIIDVWQKEYNLEKRLLWTVVIYCCQ